MAEITKEKVFEFFDKLTLLELSEFVEEFEERYKVSAAPMMVAGPAQAGGAAPAQEEEEQTEFNVILAEVGDKKIDVIKEVRKFTTLGLKEAKAVVEEAPSPVKEGVSKEEAEEIKKKLEAVGAKAEIK